jgi:hypothetical protein
MNMRSLTILLGAITTFALSACTVVSSTSSSTGTGGSDATSTTSGATGTGSTATGVGGSGGTMSTGTAMCDPKYTCSEAISTPDGNPAELCDGPEKTAFTAYADCTCTGACATACADSACKQLEASTECKTCLSDSTTGCGKELITCATGS